MNRTRIIPLEHLLLVALATLWGASYTFIKVGVETIPPITLIAARTLVAGALLCLFMRIARVEMPTNRALWSSFLAQACLNSVVPFTLIAWAEQTVDAGLAAILNSTAPIFVFLLTFLFARSAPFCIRRLLGTLIGMAGICLIIGPEALTGLGQELVAQMALLVATVSYAGAAIFGHRFRGYAPIVPAAGSMLCGAVILIPASLVMDRPWTLAPSIESLLALAALSILSTALAYVIYFRLLRTLGPVGTTSQAYLRVPIGVCIGVLFLEEKLTTSAWIGLIGVVVGVAAMTIGPQARKA